MTDIAILLLREQLRHRLSWNNWNNAENEKTAWFAELGSTGPGAAAAKRVAWARTLSAKEAAAFAPERFLRGKDGWNPAR